MKQALLILMAFAIGGLHGCSNDENLDPALPALPALYATWQVTKVEGQYYWNGVPTFPGSDNDPTGTVKFEDDGTGYQNYSYEISGTTHQHIGSFTWEADDNEIRIDRVD